MDKNKQYKVMIGVPSNGKWCAHTGQNLMHIVSRAEHWAREDGIDISLITNNKQGSLITKNRNEIVFDALDMGCTHLFFVDSDMMFPINIIERFLSHNKGVIGVNAVIRGGANFTARLKNKVIATTAMTTGVGAVDNIGTGGMFIDCKVFKKLQFPYFFLALNKNPEGEAIEMITDRHCRKLGRQKASEIGEDYYFCEQVKKAGYDIFIDQDVSKLVVHIGEKGYAWKDYYRINLFRELEDKLLEYMGADKKTMTDSEYEKYFSHYIAAIKSKGVVPVAD